MKRTAVLIALTALAFTAAYGLTRLVRRPPDPPAGMVWVPGGEFVMGSGHPGAPNVERPAHVVRVDGFWMDEHEVANALVHHTDKDREWAYDRTSHVGKLDKALQEAPKAGWVIVDMKAEWKVMYPFQK